MKDNPIPQTGSAWGIGHLVQNEIYARLEKINKDAAKNVQAKKRSTTQKIGDFWRSGMDGAGIEKGGSAL